MPAFVVCYCRVAIHKEIVNVQVEMLRQFQIQQVSEMFFYLFVNKLHFFQP